MAKVNVDILGISELKWTGMGEFNSDDHYIYYCGQESLRRNGVAIMINKRVQNAVLGCNLKNDKNDLCSLPRHHILMYPKKNIPEKRGKRLIVPSSLPWSPHPQESTLACSQSLKTM